MKAIAVMVKFSEFNALNNKKGQMMTFADFEKLAASGAFDAEQDGFYNKTEVDVLFDSGDTYNCRLDLGKSCKGFADHVANRIAFSKTDRYKEMMKIMGGNDSDALDFIKKIEF